MSTVNGFEQHKDGWWWPEGAKETDIQWSLTKNKSLQFVFDLVKKGVVGTRSVIQAGGAFGVWPKMLSKVFDTVYTYEPEPRSFQGLCLNCPEENIVKLNAAMGDKHRPLTLQKRGFSSHHIIGNSTAGNTIQIPIDFLEILNCDAIIMDVEGYEFYALRGALITLDQCRPIVLVEDRKLQEKFFDLEENCVPELMKSRGYEMIADIGHDKIFLPTGVKWQ